MEYKNLFELAYNLYEEAITDFNYHIDKSQMAANLVIMDTCTAVKFAI